jgi:trans-AT polyketide synthase, acyltransferase and oxidoreductase domains
MDPLFSKKNVIGYWQKGDCEPETGSTAIKKALDHVTEPISLINMAGRLGVGCRGRVIIGDIEAEPSPRYPLLAYAPALHPGDLGDLSFKNAHGLQYAYVVGAMANGITSIRMVEEAGRAGMIGFFGAAGLMPAEIESAIVQLQTRCGNFPFGFNLINSPNDPDLEKTVVDLYLRKGIRRISASAYLDLTLPLIYYRVSGIHQDSDGNIICPNKIIAKVSRIEIAEKFLSPPPEKLLSQLVADNRITPEEAALAKQVPVAEDLTAEADSGGHTDNRPALSLLPTMIALRDDILKSYGVPPSLRIGLGGGIADPVSTAAAFSMGAAYVLTGSVNQSCIESGTSDEVRQMLAVASQADIAMAPAADMFEMGVKVQVLKRGTMFPFRAAKLYELYAAHDCYESIPQKQKHLLERDFFRCSFDTEWERTKSFFNKRDPKQVERGKKDPKHRMALVFRSYLGQSSNWANTGDPERKIDYQIWCGPAMGAFNQWVKGSFLGNAENRQLVTVAKNLLFGASVIIRTNWLKHQGVQLPAGVGGFDPKPSEAIDCLLSNTPDQGHMG